MENFGRTHPMVALATHVNRGRSNHVATVTSQVDTLGEVNSIRHDTPGMGKIQVASAAAALGLDGLGQGAMFPLQSSATQVSATTRIQVQHHE